MNTLHPLQIRRFREMSFQEKYRVSLGMMRLARATRFRVFQKLHPTWSEAQCHAAVAQEFLRGRP